MKITKMMKITEVMLALLDGKRVASGNAAGYYLLKDGDIYHFEDKNKTPLPLRAIYLDGNYSIINLPTLKDLLPGQFAKITKGCHIGKTAFCFGAACHEEGVQITIIEFPSWVSPRGDDVCSEIECEIITNPLKKV